MGVLQIVINIAAPVQVCFDLSRSIELHLESMVASRERAVAGVTSGLIGSDEEVTWEARHLGITWRVTSRITAFEPPYRFVDEMTRGPFALFRHEHQFEARQGWTRMTDVVTFRTRSGPVTPVADLVAGAYLRRLMVRRNATIREHAEHRNKRATP